MLKVLWSRIGKYKNATYMSIFLVVAEAIFEILIPFMMSKILDKGVNAGNMGNVFFYGVVMVCLSAASLTCGVLCGRSAAYASSGFAANLREGMYKNIQTFSFSNIDKYSTAGLVTRLTTDVTNIQNSYQMMIRMMMRAPAMMIAAFVMTTIISPKIALIFLVAIIFLAAVLLLIMKSATKLFSQLFRKYDDLNASVEENVKGIRVVKSFVKEDYEIKKFGNSIQKIYDLGVRAEAKIAINLPILMLTIYACILILSWVGAHYIVSGSLTTGELTSLFAYVMNIFISLMLLSFTFVMITMSEASAERVAGVLTEKTDITSPEQAVMEVKDGSIDFENVNFSYGKIKKDKKKFVLSDIDLHIRAGETIGIIGGTGSSKTSLVNLISRLYDTTEGMVKVGGIDVRKYNLTVLRDKVAVVLQKNELFTGTILENLRWGDKNATDEECIRACKIACADEFIERFPDQYETRIEQGGSNVSGGQKQRLCIARALLKKPKVIIFDDSTSAVDTATDAKIRKALREDIPDTTKIIIAQRISSVKDADRIIVLDRGRISGVDTHENLLMNNEIYRAVAQAQMEGSGDFDKVGA